ncbi:hypothetical protein H6G04_33695 [Calothrix membranacea FACHB-236]|nr:hypothetical protein [Calothrix membranacea FACHB-236]
MPNEPKPSGFSYSIGDNNTISDSPNIQGDNNIIGERKTSNGSDLKAEIQEVLNLYDKNPVTRDEVVATVAIKEHIKKNPSLKQRLINALKAGGTEGLKQIFQHPGVSISIETIKGFLEGNSA